MEKLATTFKYAHVAEIRGHGPGFPLDMLRYDRCYPATEYDTHQLDRALAPPGDRPSVWTVKVVRYTTHKNADWTLARWASFSVTCFPLDN